jgi:mono/diheme cytochrome c family protein
VKRLHAGSSMSASLAALTAALLLSVPAHAADGNTTPSARGRALFDTYCVLCHGSSGKGDGRAATLQKVRPSDLTASARSDDYKVQIISNGGASMNRSQSMPPWKTVLSQQQIADVVVYLRGIAEHGNAHASPEAHAHAKHEQPSTGANP